ncbi:Hypothetical_protein [Hexamita inflata]|uniref:Hypothetical_protein n=1 Tax=Hexamita inflata TaxID=28002 RepID=A0AA86N6S4_9EUKA|nr:Hypothetical protein HINF_LOCUS1582 [Hexamita inflata]
MLNSAYTQHSQGETCHTQGQRLVQMQFNSKQVSCVLYKQSNRSQITLKQLVCGCKVSQEMNVYQYNVIIYIVNAAQLSRLLAFPTAPPRIFLGQGARPSAFLSCHCEREMEN